MADVDLFQAVRLKQTDVFLRALREGADVNVLNEFGQNLLHEAIAYDNDAAAEALIARGIDVNHTDDRGGTPLHIAAERRNADIAERIVAAGGRLDVADEHGNEPLWTAAFNARGDYRVVEAFVRNGANAAHKNNAGRSPFDFARQIKDARLEAALARTA